MVEEKVVVAGRKVVEQVEVDMVGQDDELIFSKKEQPVLVLELDKEGGTEADPTWPTQGGTRATRPHCQILRLRQPRCFLDSGLISQFIVPKS